MTLFGIEDIFTNILVDSKTSDLNDMVVDISRFKMKIGNNPIEAKMNLRTIMTDPNVDAFVNGKLDLDELAKAFPMEGVSDLNGISLGARSLSNNQFKANLQTNFNLTIIDWMIAGERHTFVSYLFLWRNKFLNKSNMNRKQWKLTLLSHE